ncbi:MAG: (2Fe-2S)-binding protein [Bdellovibrionales bacterium]
MGKSKREPSEIICLCNSVDRKTIVDAIKRKKLKKIDQIFDYTTAGVGACGGSCREQLKQILEKTKISEE